MNFIPVRIGTLRPDDVISFDVYIQLGDRHVHYIKKSDPFDGDRITRLKSKGVKKLYIPDDAEPDYLTYLDAGLDKLQNASVSIAEKTTLLRDSMVTDAENVARNVQTKSGYEHTENRMKKMVEFLTSDMGIMKKTLEAAGASQDSFQHAANVVTLALGVANQCGINSPKDLLEMGMTCLLHDIAYSQLDFNPRVPRNQLSAEQWQRYQEHPTSGARMLADKPYITKGILTMIADHEEIGDGQGFPAKKRLSTLSGPQQIINLANEYDRFSLIRNQTHRETAKTFFQERIGYFELNHIKFLVSLLK